MHEMSLITQMMELAEENLAQHQKPGGQPLVLTKLRVRYGSLSNVVPDAMQFAFEAITQGTRHEGAVMELVEEKAMVRCLHCGQTFAPENAHSFFAPCPHCGENTPYSLDNGTDVFLDHLEAKEAEE